MLTRIVLFLITLASLLSAADGTKIPFAPGDNASRLAKKFTGNPDSYKCATYFDQKGRDLHLTNPGCKVTTSQLEKFPSILPGSYMIMPSARVNTTAVNMDHETLLTKCSELKLDGNNCHELAQKNHINPARLFTGEIRVPSNSALNAKDVTAPTAPKVHASVVDSTIQLEWEASADPPQAGHETSGVAKYTIFRNGTQLNTTSNPGYNDTTADPGITYTYTATATDAAGNTSPPSAPESITLKPPLTPNIIYVTLVGVAGVLLSFFLLFLAGETFSTYRINKGGVKFRKVFRSVVVEKVTSFWESVQVLWRVLGSVKDILYSPSTPTPQLSKPKKDKLKPLSIVFTGGGSDSDLDRLAEDLLHQLAVMKRPLSKWQDHFYSTRQYPETGQVKLFVHAWDGGCPNLDARLSDVQEAEKIVISYHSGSQITHSKSRKTVWSGFRPRSIEGVTFELQKLGGK